MAEIEVFLQGEGRQGTEVLRVPAKSTVADLLKVAQSQGSTKQEVSGLSVYAEGSDDPLPLEGDLAEVGVKEHDTLHIATSGRRINVAVHFNGVEKQQSFGPGVPLRVVLRWAVGKHGFDLSAGRDTEYTFHECGTEKRPDLDLHLGSLAPTSSASICFDLAPKRVVQG